MAIARRPSKITLPNNNNGKNDLLSFLVEHFPLIGEKIWRERMENGKLHWDNGDAVDIHTQFIPNRRLCYYREVTDELKVPFKHQLVYRDQHIVIACKPHFLQVTPGGQYVRECLLERLREELDVNSIVPVHRLDRETAGLVMFSINPKSRHQYYQLFSERKINKLYHAVADLSTECQQEGSLTRWQINNRLAKSKPSFIMREVEGDINARSTIQLIKKSNQRGLFELSPHTGKTHQLRLHMSKINMPILYDRFYPELQPEKAPDFKRPLQLLAKQLSFIDPVSQKQQVFTTRRHLSEWAETSSL